ncbi:YrhK family protein [Microbacterium oleivorans]|uniref:YrhK family protein n=1 Tax=Microbacterium oleivorans TaxID=273677 RepID=UPI00080DE29D|nr:YrhK family protein [Microbacterium oleivorans]
MASRDASDDRTIRFSIGRDEIVIRRKYEVASILNDVMVAGWFIVGSILFFSESTTTIGTWLFLLGSIQLLIRPLIRLARHVHLRRLGGGAPGDSARDF